MQMHQKTRRLELINELYLSSLKCCFFYYSVVMQALRIVFLQTGKITKNDRYRTKD